MADFNRELHRWIDLLGLGRDGLWTDNERKMVQKAILVDCALGVIEDKREEKLSLHAPMERELACFLCAENEDFVLPEGLSYEDLRNVSKGKVMTGEKAWNFWLESRKVGVKYHAAFCELFPQGKLPSGDQNADAVRKWRQALSKIDVAEKAEAKKKEAAKKEKKKQAEAPEPPQTPAAAPQATTPPAPVPAAAASATAAGVMDAAAARALFPTEEEMSAPTPPAPGAPHAPAAAPSAAPSATVFEGDPKFTSIQILVYLCHGAFAASSSHVFMGQLKNGKDENEDEATQAAATGQCNATARKVQRKVGRLKRKRNKAMDGEEVPDDNSDSDSDCDNEGALLAASKKLCAQLEHANKIEALKTLLEFCDADEKVKYKQELIDLIRVAGA